MESIKEFICYIMLALNHVPISLSNHILYQFINILRSESKDNKKNIIFTQVLPRILIILVPLFLIIDIILNIFYFLYRSVVSVSYINKQDDEDIKLLKSYNFLYLKHTFFILLRMIPNTIKGFFNPELSFPKGCIKKEEIDHS